MFEGGDVWKVVCRSITELGAFLDRKPSGLWIIQSSRDYYDYYYCITFLRLFMTLGRMQQLASVHCTVEYVHRITSPRETKTNLHFGHHVSAPLVRQHFGPNHEHDDCLDDLNVRFPCSLVQRPA